MKRTLFALAAAAIEAEIGGSSVRLLAVVVAMIEQWGARMLRCRSRRGSSKSDLWKQSVRSMEPSLARRVGVPPGPGYSTQSLGSGGGGGGGLAGR